ncbi:MAG: Crp/Fnr family transcriptional regulator [Oscillatoriales cyanobacterium SM2_2_1]|nr:Crp/Fnr family transcriptional regulator [Oscillatoriales cyanobacterium SM2_2_1]
MLSEVQKQLASAAFFAGLSELSVQRSIAHVSSRDHPADQVILLENDWGNSVYFVLKGWVKIRTYNLDGKEITLNILGSGEMFGEMAPLDQVPRSTDVLTLTPTTIASLPAPDFMQLLATEPNAGIHLARLVAKRLRQLNRRLRLREADSTARVADVLLFLAEGQGVPGAVGIEIPNLPHREISCMSGLARETVTRSLGKLEKKNLVRRDPERDVLCILDPEGLEAIMV